MTRHLKVVWNEGMHLAQHHFQSQSRYFEETIRFALSELYYKPYGLAASGLDSDAISNGTVSVTHARGVMPDGTIPENDEAPETFDINPVFLPTDSEQTLVLVLPPVRPGSANCSESPSADLRYVAVTQSLPDETTGLDEKPVVLGKKNFRLALASEVEDDLVALPLARIKRDGTGRFAYDPDFIGPTVQIGGNSRIMELLGQLLQLLEQKAEALALERDPGGGTFAQYGGQELASFWLAHAIHSALAPLRHLFEKRKSHPEELYSELARLAGALCTFSLRTGPDQVPKYDHEGLENCFNTLDKHIRQHLEVTLPTTCVKVEIQQRNLPSVYTGAVRDEMLSDDAQWIFGVLSEEAVPATVRAVTRKVKFASKTDLPDLVRTSGMAGLKLEHLTRPPRELAPRVGWEYFLIKRTGPRWPAIQDSKEIGIWVPDELVAAELELAVVMRTDA